MIEIITRNKKKLIPEYIDELTPEQYEYYLRICWVLSAGAIDLEYFRTRWFSYLIGMEGADFILLKKEHRRELEAQISAVDGFIVTTPDGREAPDLCTCRNLMPKAEGYTGPGDWLDGVNFGTFTDCLMLMSGMDGADPEELEEICGSIARKLYGIPEEAPVPPLLAFHAPQLVASVWKEVTTHPVDVNGRQIDFRIIFQKSGPSKADDKTGWTGVLYEVASAGLFGTVRDVEKTDMWEVLLYLYKCKFEYLEELKKNKS